MCSLLFPRANANNSEKTGYGGSVWESNLAVFRIQRSYKESQHLWNNTWECVETLIAHGLPTRFFLCSFPFWQHHLNDFAIRRAQRFRNCLGVDVQGCSNVSMAQ